MVDQEVFPSSIVTAAFTAKGENSAIIVEKREKKSCCTVTINASVSFPTQLVQCRLIGWVSSTVLAKPSEILQ